MPSVEEVKSSWADDIEDENSISLPPPTEVIENGYKIVTEYKLDENNKKVKVVRTYKIEKIIVSKSVARRKTWHKFGESKNDKPGPNAATTAVAEDVQMQFVSSKEEEKTEEDALDKLKYMGEKGVVKCRICSGDHWTTKCPYKDTIQGDDRFTEKKAVQTGGTSSLGFQDDKKPQAGKYVPPSLRGDGSKKTDTGANPRRDDTVAIRIANLSDSTTEKDLEELVAPFGPTQKLFLAKDKATNQCKGFAYIHFKSRASAARAIECLHGHGYDHLILSVDWSKPANN